MRAFQTLLIASLFGASSLLIASACSRTGIDDDDAIIAKHAAQGCMGDACACVPVCTGVTCGGGDGCGGTCKTGNCEGGQQCVAGTCTAPCTSCGALTALTAGDAHTCALQGGAAKCWGSNMMGQLGNGTAMDATTFVSVMGLSSGVQSISAGAGHTCALLATGAVQCWGDNGFGQLGNGSATGALMPIGVSGLSSGVVALAAGTSHTCAALSDGTVACWGENSHGQLGSQGTKNSLVPVAVTGLFPGVIALAAGSGHTCALSSSGGVQCWGENSDGQLGNDLLQDSTMPVDVSKVTSGVTAIAAGDSHTCAVVSGAAMCWGNNGLGQLGNPQSSYSALPVDVMGLSSGVLGVAAQGYHSCALTTGGGVQCWGDNDSGDLGNDSVSEGTAPVGVLGLSSGASAIALGGTHTCALLSAGGAKCWGSNSNGQLGNGSTENSLVPVSVVGF